MEIPEICPIHCKQGPRWSWRFLNLLKSLQTASKMILEIPEICPNRCKQFPRWSWRCLKSVRIIANSLHPRSWGFQKSDQIVASCLQDDLSDSFIYFLQSAWVLLISARHGREKHSFRKLIFKTYEPIMANFLGGVYLWKEWSGSFCYQFVTFSSAGTKNTGRAETHWQHCTTCTIFRFAEKRSIGDQSRL